MKILAVLAAVLLAAPGLRADDLTKQNEELFKELQAVHKLSNEQMTKIKAIFAASGYLSQGNPAVTKHPVSREQCEEKRKKAGIMPIPEFEKICSSKNMAPLYDPEKEKPEQAKTCIDQYEFPSIPCAYPVVWVRAKEAQEICAVMGKRMCDAHEWEGACEGRLTEADYPFEAAKGKKQDDAFRAMRTAHNNKYAGKKTWSYGGDGYQKGVCGGASSKDAACNGGNWQQCGSNTYPTGFFPGCKSPLEVYDIHGNAAEHMNLPLSPDEMTSRGSTKLGQTEMKGSWFIFDKYYAHQDWCRWRAPYWHGSRVMDAHSHHNYHLGFRCCKTLE